MHRLWLSDIIDADNRLIDSKWGPILYPNCLCSVYIGVSLALLNEYISFVFRHDAGDSLDRHRVACSAERITSDEDQLCRMYDGRTRRHIMRAQEQLEGAASRVPVQTRCTLHNQSACGQA